MIAITTTTTSSILFLSCSSSSLPLLRSKPVIGPVRGMADEEEEGHGDGPEGDELGVAAGHAIALSGPVDPRRSFLLDEALEEKIDGLAAQLAGKHEHDLGLAGGPDQGYVDDTEGLGDEGEPGAEVGDWIGGVLLFWERGGEGGSIWLAFFGCCCYNRRDEGKKRL